MAGLLVEPPGHVLSVLPYSCSREWFYLSIARWHVAAATVAWGRGQEIGLKCFPFAFLFLPSYARRCDLSLRLPHLPPFLLRADDYTEHSTGAGSGGGIITPEAYVRHAQLWVAAGATIVGGCCGIGPDHIRALRAALKADVS